MGQERVEETTNNTQYSTFLGISERSVSLSCDACITCNKAVVLISGFVFPGYHSPISPQRDGPTLITHGSIDKASKACPPRLPTLLPLCITIHSACNPACKMAEHARDALAATVKEYAPRSCISCVSCYS
jgi:hypothetical protein